jgi:hypothetical protein
LVLKYLNCKIRIQGAGKYTTNLRAAPGLFAIIELGYTPPSSEATYLEISELSIIASTNADYGIYAPLITRSYFNNIFFLGGNRYGFYINGWINVIDQCSFDGAGIAGLMVAGNNMVVTTSSFEGNRGSGIHSPWANQLTISNCVIEGNNGFGTVLNGVNGLTLTGNYFEKNCAGGPQSYNVTSIASRYNSPRLVKYHTDLVADVILGNGKRYPTRAATVTGNTFAPDSRPQPINYTITAIVLNGVTGATFADNIFSGLTSDPFFYLDLSSAPNSRITMKQNMLGMTQSSTQVYIEGMPLGVLFVNTSEMPSGSPSSSVAEDLSTWRVEGLSEVIGSQRTNPQFVQSFHSAIPLVPENQRGPVTLNI